MKNTLNLGLMQVFSTSLRTMQVKFKEITAVVFLLLVPIGVLLWFGPSVVPSWGSGGNAEHPLWPAPAMFCTLLLGTMCVLGIEQVLFIAKSTLRGATDTAGRNKLYASWQRLLSISVVVFLFSFIGAGILLSLFHDIYAVTGLGQSWSNDSVDSRGPVFMVSQAILGVGICAFPVFTFVRFSIHFLFTIVAIVHRNLPWRKATRYSQFVSHKSGLRGSVTLIVPFAPKLVVHFLTSLVLDVYGIGNMIVRQVSRIVLTAYTASIMIIGSFVVFRNTEIAWNFSGPYEIIRDRSKG